MIDVKVRLDDGAYMPTRGHAADAGLDLRTPRDLYIPSLDSVEVDTGVHLTIPDGYCGLVVAKSGLNVNEKITVTGLIDANFTNSIKLRLYNHNDIGAYELEAGDKCAQIVFLEVPYARLVLDVVQKPNKERGDDGYGSTGR